MRRSSLLPDQPLDLHLEPACLFLGLRLRTWLADGSPVQVVAFAQRVAEIEFSTVDRLVRLDNELSLSITFNATVSFWLTCL